MNYYHVRSKKCAYHMPGFAQSEFKGFKSWNFLDWVSGKILGSITGIDLRHLLLLLPFLLFDLLDEERKSYNQQYGTNLVNPCHELPRKCKPPRKFSAPVGVVSKLKKKMNHWLPAPMIPRSTMRR